MRWVPSVIYGSNREVADRLHLAETTVKGYVSELLTSRRCATAPNSWCWPTSRGWFDPATPRPRLEAAIDNLRDCGAPTPGADDHGIERTWPRQV